MKAWMVIGVGAAVSAAGAGVFLHRSWTSDVQNDASEQAAAEHSVGLGATAADAPAPVVLAVHGMTERSKVPREVQREDGSRYVWSHPADLTRDGVLDAADWIAFRDALARGDALADVNTDGRLDAADVAAFGEMFEHGEWHIVEIC